MRKFLMSLSIAFMLTSTVFAQENILTETQPAWYNNSFEDDGIYGVNTEKAWQFLKEHNRKPVELIVGV
ncbi:MAG: peptidase S8, partial [Weeksellaceae bacterium]|nr:peptidase S8 [Weeksellaceae bacterium]